MKKISLTKHVWCKLEDLHCKLTAWLEGLVRKRIKDWWHFHSLFVRLSSMHSIKIIMAKIVLSQANHVSLLNCLPKILRSHHLMSYRRGLSRRLIECNQTSDHIWHIRRRSGEQEGNDPIGSRAMVIISNSILCLIRSLLYAMINVDVA